MSAKTQPLPAFIRNMTPEKFQAMSKEEQRAYKQRSDDVMKERDARIQKTNAQNHENLAFGVAQLVNNNPLIQTEVVHNFLEKHGLMLISVDFYNKHPQFAQALAAYELERLNSKKAGRQSSARRSKTVRNG